MTQLLLFFLACSAMSSPASVYTGTIEVTQVQVAAAVPGRLVDVRFHEGDRVALGDVVFTLDDATYAAQRDLGSSGVNMAEAGVAAARAQVAAGDAQVAFLTRELKRVRDLEAAGVASDQQAATLSGQLDVARATVRSGRERVAQAQAGVGQAQAGVRAAEKALSETQVAAAVAGVVLSRNREPGEVVAPGMSVLTLGELDSPWLRVYVPLLKLETLSVGDPVQVRLDGDPSVLHPGKIRRIASEAEFTPREILTPDERVKRVFAVDIDVPPARGLHPGLPAEALFAEAP